MISRFFKHLWESIKSLKRNGWMTFAAISSVAITLTLVGIFASVILNAAKLTSDIENNVRINVFLKVDTHDNDKKYIEKGTEVVNKDYHKIYDAIEKMENVDKISFSSKDEQLAALQKTMGDAWKIFDGDANPLSDTYIVDTVEPKHVKSTAKAIEKLDGVSKVAYGGVSTDRLFKLAANIRTWGLAGTALLVLTAVFLISNTVRITIISRSREIQIMRLVGAKNSYIRGPFLLEGAWVGLFGTILPALVIYFGYQTAYSSFNHNLTKENLSMIPQDIFIPGMIGALLIIGILIGSIGSGIAMRRYLKI